MAFISANAFAKINLSLDVTGRFANGYHSIRSVMHAVDICDDITIETHGNAGLLSGVSVKIEVANRGEEGGVIPSGENNIMYRAAVAVADRFCPSVGNKIRINIAKKIPVAAGLGGGSADAAVAILALARLWEVNAELPALLDIGKSVGADVPFCLISNAKLNPTLGFAEDRAVSTCALAEGIGEILTPLASAGGAAILVKSNISVQTSDIYALFDEYPPASARPDTEELSRALSLGKVMREEDRVALSRNMTNVLEPVTAGLRPEIYDIMNRIKAASSPDRVFMSGSGPTVVAYFANRAAADIAAGQIKKAFAEGKTECPRVIFAALP